MPLEKIPTLTVNGINGVTGTYDVPAVSASDLAHQLRGSPRSARVSSYQTDRGRRLAKRAFALPIGVQPEDVASAGWGIVFHAQEDLAVKRALEPLVKHRRAQIHDDTRVKELGYAPDDTVEGWLAQRDVAWGDIQPARVPYYLLIVGSPSRIPYEFVQTLDAEYCVGILDLADAAAYDRYVRSVIEYESARQVENRREVVYFGTHHPFDEATSLSANYLVTPLVNGLPERGLKPIAEEGSFAQRMLLAAAATRSALIDVLNSAAGPQAALLFTATHGMVWPSGDAQQSPAQGALVCQDWGGLNKIGAGDYFAAADVPDTAKLQGVIAFLFACFGAGTPQEDRFAHEPGVAPPTIAPRAFEAALPARLLTHGGGGALACIGHVERAWGYSIVGQSSDAQIGPFRRALWRLMRGHPVALAVQEFNDKCAVASVSLANLLEKAYAGKPVDDLQLTATWAERNDAQGYVTIGDPAVRIRVVDLV